MFHSELSRRRGDPGSLLRTHDAARHSPRRLQSEYASMWTRPSLQGFPSTPWRTLLSADSKMAKPPAPVSSRQTAQGLGSPAVSDKRSFQARHTRRTPFLIHCPSLRRGEEKRAVPGGLEDDCGRNGMIPENKRSKGFQGPKSRSVSLFGLMTNRGPSTDRLGKHYTHEG